MAITGDYLSELYKTKTYKEGVITAQEYKLITKFGGLYRFLSEIPHADEDKHIVVLKLLGNKPVIYKVLTNSEMTINLKTTDANKLLFIFVKRKPNVLKVASPKEGYQLGDGHHIHASFAVTYRISDVEKFWRGAKDPIAVLEDATINEAKKYFLSVTSHYLISSSVDLKKSIEDHIDTEIKKVKNSLEKNIKNNLNAGNGNAFLVAGIEIIKVHVNVQLINSLNELLKRTHDKMYISGGVIDNRHDKTILSEHRKNIDELIDRDTTFHPYKLRDIIMALDTGLLENFYSMDWGVAMRNVHKELSIQKKKILEEQKMTMIEECRSRLEIAVEAQLDEIEIARLKTKLGEILKGDSSDTSDSSEGSNNTGPRCSP